MADSEYRLSPKARDDMEVVWLYSLTEWGADQAGKYLDDLVDAFDFLLANPKLGKACDNIRSGYRKHPTLRHVIYYRETAYGIEVIRVLHDKRLAARWL